MDGILPNFLSLVLALDRSGLDNNLKPFRCLNKPSTWEMLKATPRTFMGDVPLASLGSRSGAYPLNPWELPN